jgi:N-acetylneuraminic acid mutarotase
VTYRAPQNVAGAGQKSGPSALLCEVRGLLCASLVAIAISPFGDKLVWHERAELKQPRAGYMAGVIDGRYVIAGGSYWTGGKKIWTDEVDIFDPVHNTWTEGARLPQPRSDAANVVVEGGLYTFGGGEGDDVRRDAWVFKNGRWTELATGELPEPRVYAVAVAVRGLIYLVGGMSNHTDWYSLSNELWVWNPRSRAAWKKLAPMPGPGLITAAVATLNDKIYVLGGAKTGGKDVVNVKSAFEFDPQTGNWTSLPDLPIDRRCWWGLPHDDKILLFGGYTNTNEADVFAYRPATHTLANVGAMPHGLCDAKFFRIGNSIYGVGGESAPAIRGKWTLQADFLER